jgi:hypothetical protein
VTTDTEQVQPAASLQNQVAVAHRTALIIVLSFAMSIIIYMAVALVKLNLNSTRVQGQVPYAFYGAAAALAIGSIVVRRVLLQPARLEAVATNRGVEGLIKHLLNSTIIAAAVAEVIGLLALIVGFFGGDQNDVVRLTVVGLAVSLYNYPRRSAWERAAYYFAGATPNTGAGKLGL